MEKLLKVCTHGEMLHKVFKACHTTLCKIAQVVKLINYW